MHHGRSVWGAALKVLAITTAVVVASSASVAAIGVWSLGRTVAANAVDISNGGAVPTIAAMNGSFNVLLVGADNAPGQKSFGGARDATLNDVNILVHIAADHRSGVVMSLPRDLVIAHPECEDPTTHETFSAMAAQPLNTAFARGGLGCVVSTVENLTGVKVPYAALFSFEGTVKMADAVGGVPVCVTKAIDDPDSGLKLPAGRSVISGRTALAYLRSRHGVGDGSDLSRIGSQQAYMSSLLRTMMSRDTFTNPVKLYGLAQAAAQNVRLSQSLASEDTIVTMALALKGMNLQHLVFVQYPSGADPAEPEQGRPEHRARRPADAPHPRRPAGGARRVLPRAQHRAGDRRRRRRRRAHREHVHRRAASPTPKPTKTSTAVIGGLRGQTAAQQTCSIARQLTGRPLRWEDPDGPAPSRERPGVASRHEQHGPRRRRRARRHFRSDERSRPGTRGRVRRHRRGRRRLRRAAQRPDGRRARRPSRTTRTPRPSRRRRPPAPVRAPRTPTRAGCPDLTVTSRTRARRPRPHPSRR